MEEQFKKFHDNKIYDWFISNYGNIKTIDKRTGKTKIRKSYGFGGHTSKSYLGVSINDAPEKYIHRIVATAFIPNPQAKATVNHIDGNKHNNHIDNLEWATYTENMQHAMATGLRGANSGCHGQKESTLLLWNKIIKLKESGMTYKEIGIKLNISSQHAAISYRRANGSLE